VVELKGSQQAVLSTKNQGGKTFSRFFNEFEQGLVRPQRGKPKGKDRHPDSSPGGRSGVQNELRSKQGGGGGGARERGVFLKNKGTYHGVPNPDLTPRGEEGASNREKNGGDTQKSAVKIKEDAICLRR